MQNFIQPGNTVSLTAPAGGVASGGAVLAGGLFGVAATATDEGAPVECAVAGVFRLPAAAADTFTQGGRVFWDAAAGAITTVAAGNPAVGTVLVPAGPGAATVIVRLDPAGGSAAPVPVHVTARLADVSTAGSVFVPAPVTGTITAAWATLQGAITVADATLSLSIAGTPVTGGAITLPFDGSAAGTTAGCTPTADNAVTAGQAIEIASDGGSTDTAAAEIVIAILP